MTSHRVNLKLFINKPNYFDKDSRLYISFLIHHTMNHCKTGIDTMNLLFCIIYNPLSLELEDLNVYLYCAPCVGGMLCVCIAVHKTIQIVAFIVVTDMHGYCKKPFAMLFI